MFYMIGSWCFKQHLCSLVYYTRKLLYKYRERKDSNPELLVENKNVTSVLCLPNPSPASSETKFKLRRALAVLNLMIH